jgi:structural maintenance of chromosome 2
VGGKNKYIVNGRSESQQDVANMFQSVQLNVNNPNFLIMQGKITQVLNMKPTQILGMIQEAAGTRLYEDRKEKALKAMEKKDLKLQHSSMLIDTEITPKLDELREKKRVLLEYQKLKSEKEQLEKILVASEYCKLQTNLEKYEEKQQFSTDRLKHLEKMQRILKEEIKEIESRIEEVTADRAKNGGSYFELEQELKDLGKEMIRLKTLLSLKEATYKDEEEQMKELAANAKEAETSLADAQARLSVLKANCQETIERHDKIQAEVKDTANLLQTLTTGLASTEGQENGFIDQLVQAKQDVTHATAEIQQMKMTISHLQKELKTEEPKAKAAKKENQSLMRELDSAKNVLEIISEELDSFQFDSAQEQVALARKTEIETQLSQISKKIQEVERSVHGLEFTYSDPYPGFDRSKVKGLVANLITIPKEHVDKATALEVCAGGKLYQVVVESQDVATQLIQKGKLRRRVTIIPLNKISAFKVQAERIATAKKLAPGDVDLALTLIGSDKELEQAMNYVFGSTLICSGPDVAKMVTFDKRVQLRSVTLEGDVYDPSGQLSGGARQQTTGSLLRIQELKQLQITKTELEREYQSALNDYEDIKSKKQLWNSMKQKKELKEHEFGLLQKRLSNNPHFKVIQNVEEMIQKHSEAKSQLDLAQQKLKDSQQRVLEIEKEMNELTNNREGKLKSLQNQIKNGKKELAGLQPTVEKMQEQIMLIEAECTQMEGERERIDQLMKQLDQQMKSTSTEDSALKKEIHALETTQMQLNIRLKEERKALTKFDKELQQCEQMIQQKSQQIEDGKLEAQQLQVELANASQGRDAIASQLRQLEKANQWIPDQEQYSLFM